MGYETYFTGSLAFNRPIDDETKKMFDEVFDTAICMEKYPDDPLVPMSGCPWALTENNDALVIEGGEGGTKAYFYLEWLNFLHERIVKPRGYRFVDKDNICWIGDEQEDFGCIEVGLQTGDPVVCYGRMIYGEPEPLPKKDDDKCDGRHD